MLSKRETNDIRGAFEYEEGFYVFAAIIRSNKRTLVHSEDIARFAGDLVTDVYDSLLNENDLLYLLELPV